MHRPRAGLGRSKYRAVQAGRTEVRSARHISGLTYLVSLGNAFINAIDVKSDINPPGNRVAYSMLFTWLLPAVHLSAAAGRFVSRDICAQTINRLYIDSAQPANEVENLRFMQIPPDHPGRDMNLRIRSPTPQDGAIYTYRPQKRLFDPQVNRRIPRLTSQLKCFFGPTRSIRWCYALSCASLFISTCFAIAISAITD